MENFNISKPISMMIDDTRGQIIRILNESRLDAYTLEIVLSSIYSEIQQAANNQKKIEREAYEKALREYMSSNTSESLEKDEDTKEPVE